MPNGEPSRAEPTQRGAAALRRTLSASPPGDIRAPGPQRSAEPRRSRTERAHTRPPPGGPGAGRRAARGRYAPRSAAGAAVRGTRRTFQQRQRSPPSNGIPAGQQRRGRHRRVRLSPGGGRRAEFRGREREGRPRPHGALRPAGPPPPPHSPLKQRSRSLSRATVGSPSTSWKSAILRGSGGRE